MFAVVPASQSHVTFNNKLEKQAHLNILYYLYYYNGGGVSTGDINNDGLADIYFTANSKGNNKLYLNKGNFEFEDITEKAGVAGTADWCSGVTMADVNGDGKLDIYVSAVAGFLDLKGHNELFINNGDNTFTESAEKYGLAFTGLSTQAAFFDYDHDGDLDCYLLRHSKQPHSNIVDTANRRVVDPIAGDKLLRNNLEANQTRFTDVSVEAGIYQSSLGYGLGVSVADVNNDGWEDIYVGNDFHENDYYYLNNGNGTFTESGKKHFGHFSRFSMGNDIADYNNDGQPDIITVDMLPPDEKTLKTYGSDENLNTYNVKLKLHGYEDQFSKNCLQKNNGSGVSFSEESLLKGVSATDWSWCPLFADFDNDGNKDLFISSGIVKRPVDLDYILFVTDMEARHNANNTDAFDDETIAAMPDGSSHPFLFKGNASDKPFTDVSKEWGTGGLKGYFNGSSYADLDNDGDLDIVMNCINAPAVLLKNNAKASNYLTVTGVSDDKNTKGIGLKCYVYTGAKSQLQQLITTRGFQSSVEPRLHFGLAKNNAADSVLVVWPNQTYQLLKNVKANSNITVFKRDADGIFKYADWFPQNKPPFIDAETKIPWSHHEDDFIDYNVQYLIPHGESTRGPKIAVADVNNDGLDDIFTCGAAGQAGALMLQQINGAFVLSDTAMFNNDAICEDADAVFFDANGDKAPDLLVISGGNLVPSSSKQLEDRLYLNDGKGHFKKADNPFTQQYENKSCVAVADVDNDGDIDFFVGNLASATAFGLPKTSYLYLNNGKGQFSLAGKQVIDLNALGNVTTAVFADVNNDGFQDLCIAGEWMPLKIFINKNGTFIGSDLHGSSGLWQTLLAADVNKDGFTDLLAGNWGHNTKLFAGKNGPLKLYVKDFDNNGSTEQVMAYTIDGKEYPFLGKDELERRLPVLKKAYLTYSEVAGKTVQYMFYDLFTGYIELKADVLGSSVFINDGKGAFTRKDLPAALQLAPIFAFVNTSKQNDNSFMAAGNFSNVIPYEGKYDALFPTTFSFRAKSDSITNTTSLPATNGEFRDAKWIRGAGGEKRLVLARNNGALVFLKRLK